jgi:hypothetical protein
MEVGSQNNELRSDGWQRQTLHCASREVPFIDGPNSAHHFLNDRQG